MPVYQLSIYCAAMAMVLLLSGCARPAQSSTPPVSTTIPVTAQFAQPETQTEPTAPPENQKVQALMEEFAALYFARDRESMKAYLAEGCGSFIDAYPGDPAKVSIHAYKLPQSVTYELTANGQCQVSVEFWETPESDSYTYLSITLVAEQDAWKIQSYGLEK